jgi:hypothetical protein
MNATQPRHLISRLPPYAILGALPLVLLAPIVFGGRVLYWGVPMMQFYPWQHVAAETWRAGAPPLWNPLLGNGAPLAANLQTGAFYPLNFLYLILPTEFAMGYTAALHVALAGLFMFAFVRAIGLQTFSALIAAIAFQVSGFLIARLGFLSITAALPWVVAWLWRAERLAQSGHWRDALWLAVAVGLGLLAGHAQTSLYGLLLLAAYVASRSWRDINHQDTRSQRFLGVLESWWLRISLLSTAAVLMGIGLAAIQLLPAAELARESQRAGGLDYTFAMTHSFWPWRLLTLLTPDLFGNPATGNFWGYDNYWENAAYIGLLPLALAMFSIRDWWRYRRMKDEGGGMKIHPSSFILRPFFALVALVSLILAFGWFTPVYPFLFRTIPGFSLFQGPARWLGVFTIASCALAGLGAESMLRERGDLRRSARWIVIGVALIGAGVASRGFLTGRTATFPDATLRLGLLVAAGGLLFGLRPSIEDRRWARWAGAFAAVVAIDLITAHAALNPSIDPVVYRQPAPSAGVVRREDGRVFMFAIDDAAVRQHVGIYLPFADFGPSDAAAWLDFRATFISNTPMIDGISSANNFDSLLVGHYLELMDAANNGSFDAARRLLDLMNVRTIASPRELDLPVVHRGAGATIYRNDSALPRVWLAPSARIEDDPLAALLDPGFDPRAEVILDAASLPNPDLAPTRATPPALHFTLHSLQDTPNAVTIRAASEGEGYLVLADTWYPGWQATIDGQPAPILRANVAFRAVRFPAGDHVVRFTYQPDSVRLGAWTSFASAALIAAGLLFSMRRRA